MKLFKSLILFLLTLNITGCAGVLVAGAATTVNVALDPRTAQEILHDTNIELNVSGIGNKAPFSMNTRIIASSYKGVVVLIGQAKNEQLKQEIQARAYEIQGVRKVHNQLQIKPPLSIGDISYDSWLTTKVKSKLLAHSELSGAKIKVITEDKQVFLLGYVTDKQAVIASEIARNVAGVEKVIRAFNPEGNPVKPPLINLNSG